MLSIHTHSPDSVFYSVSSVRGYFEFGLMDHFWGLSNVQWLVVTFPSTPRHATPHAPHHTRTRTTPHTHHTPHHTHTTPHTTPHHTIREKVQIKSHIASELLVWVARVVQAYDRINVIEVVSSRLVSSLLSSLMPKPKCNEFLSPVNTNPCTLRLLFCCFSSVVLELPHSHHCRCIGLQLQNHLV